MKTYAWTVPGVDGKDHAVSAAVSRWSRKLTVTVDGEAKTVRPTGRQKQGAVTDLTLPVGGRSCRLVSIGDEADLVLDGAYLGCGKPYLPYHTMPKWVLIFWGLCVILCFVGGVVSWVVGFIASLRCGRIAMSPFREKKEQMIACATTAIAAWTITLGTTLLIMTLFS